MMLRLNQTLLNSKKGVSHMMLSDIFEFLKKNAHYLIFIPTIIGSGNFGLLLAQSLIDGSISDSELHSLMQAGSATQVGLLLLIMALLKLR